MNCTRFDLLYYDELASMNERYAVQMKLAKPTNTTRFLSGISAKLKV
jgi:hypothetical protein